MLLKKKLFEGSLKHFKRCMMHPDVAFATAVNKNGEKYVFLCNPERDLRIPGDIIGIKPHVPKSIGYMIFNCNRDIDEHEITYFTRDAYKSVPGLLYAPVMPGTLGNTNLFSAMLSDLTDQKIHLHTDTHGDEWYVDRNSFRNRCILLHYQGHKRNGLFGQERSSVRWVYSDALDQYSGEWHFDNLTKENVAKLIATKAEEVANQVAPKELTFDERCEWTEVKSGGNLIVDKHLNDGLWERKHYSLTINVEDMVTDNQILNLRTPLVNWVEQFRTGLELCRIFIDIDKCAFRYNGKLISGQLLGELSNRRFYLADTGITHLLHVRDNRKFPKTPW